MSNENIRDDVQTSAEPDGERTETQVDDTSGADDRRVSHQTYKRTVEAEKNARARARAAEERLKALEDERLAEQGNKDELIKSLKGKLDAAEKARKDLYGGFAKRSLTAQIKAEAQSAGCIDPDAVMSLADLSELEVDANTFEADADEIKSVINSLKKSKPYLFNKPAPKVNGKMPSGERPAAGMTQAELLGKSQAEIMQMLKNLK